MSFTAHAVPREAPDAPVAVLPRPGFFGAPGTDARLLTDAIQALEDRLRPGALDVLVHQALGWSVERRVVGVNGARRWMCRSRVSATWLPMPSPSRDLTAARRLVPWRWSWGTGEHAGRPYAWVAETHPVAEGTAWFEAKAATPELALLKAALHAQRHLALRALEQACSRYPDAPERR
ncbi:MAG: hypothetical protein K2X74_18995 [Acetobacteraceae bacterium]|nr:hypothetical protein [Acetobacteraceae bacterium]